ncbi:outer membrane lipoprotein pcp [Klebsiella pneumoniae]|uniref:Outer membrane lipoprotein pcp n=1 Tax=Klebsiella pneumoniae TaxID=573 RepID=A0A377TTN2_KLEPN|nr:outer membrane lipoprotein pcp [Klebsiella pneumoniae]
MILRVLAVSMIGFTLAGCVSSSGLSGDVYSASEAKQVQSVTYGTIVHTRAVQIQSGDDSNAIGAMAVRYWAGSLETPSAAVPDALWLRRQVRSRAA